MNFLSQMNKYVLCISLILNGLLLIFVAGPVPFFLYLSIVFNIALIWYAVMCLLRVNDLEEDMIGMLQQNEEFLDNLEDIHSLEMYYGDEHLQGLIDNSRALVNNFIEIQERYFDVEVADLEEDLEEGLEDGRSEENTPETSEE